MHRGGQSSSTEALLQMVPNGLGSEVASARLIMPNDKINIEDEVTMRDRSALSGMAN